MLRSEILPTSPEPVADGLVDLHALLSCLVEWIAAQRDEVVARELLRALATETLKVARSSDVSQREFDAADLAGACDWPEQSDFDAATRRMKRAELLAYASARATDLEQFFMHHGFQHALRVQKRSPGGRHRAHWYLEAYALAPSPEAVDPDKASSEPIRTRSEEVRYSITYDYAPAGQVRPSWLARPLFGRGSFRTKSLRGAVFAGTAIAPVLGIACMVALVWLMLFVKRPVTTADLALLIVAIGMARVLWISLGRGLWWLLDDRIVPAPDVLLHWREEPAQLENFKEGAVRSFGLVRYSAICPICAAKVELRYGEGSERRRLFGGCVEAPQDHLFTFDRVTRKGVYAR